MANEETQRDGPYLVIAPSPLTTTSRHRLGNREKEEGERAVPLSPPPPPPPEDSAK